jgi:hypothetical protein
MSVLTHVSTFKPAVKQQPDGARFRRRNELKKLILGAVIALSFATLGANSAAAAQPRIPACFGADISTYAGGGASFGGFISSMAVASAGVGTEIQLHQAGLVPDEAIQNTCND